jgi:RimJ/RimL family protein N-acetyltransferase
MVQLVPMTESEFQTFFEVLVPDYAQEHVQAGRWKAEEAQQKALEEVQQLLPEGQATSGHYFYSIVDEESGRRVGTLWFAEDRRRPEPSAFVYDVIIFEEFRRHGYASQAFLLMEEKVKELGLTRIGLHVFGHNHGARTMYEKLGYVTTNVTMAKTLD